MITWTAAAPLLFGVGDAESMRIHSNGNVGIGTASPETKFKVVGGSAKFVTNSGDDPLIISRFSQATATQGTQELRIGVDDGITTMHYINDESRNRIQFRMQNTDTEKGGGRGRNDNIAMTIFGDADGGGISIGGFAKKPGLFPIKMSFSDYRHRIEE